MELKKKELEWGRIYNGNGNKYKGVDMNVPLS
jgi:hypothetical protein